MSPEELRILPKVLLHDHLDGGLRPQTILELAETDGYTGLPSDNLEELTDWFFQGQSASLERYLEAFAHTVGVMQTADAIERVAYEATEDLAAQGVVYAEIRM
ncbi:MAG: adenosine deaminase, partial [Acidobacteria bacterium]|nr:adenosine deaminase [Acidobacteriota bacterium]